MSECASKYNSRAEETIYILATLLERQTAEADEAFALVNDQQREIHGLDMDLNSAALELEVALEKVAELQDDNMQLQYQVIDAADQRDAAIQRLGALDALHAHELRRAQGLEDELREANEFLTRLADLARDEDWLGIAQAFGLELATESEDGTFIPEYLETEADYESAPVGTVIAYSGQDNPGYVRIEGGWDWVDVPGDCLTSKQLDWSNHPRKVLQWGAQ